MDDFVALVAGADQVANVDGMVTTRTVLLDILNVFHTRLAIPERGQYLYLRHGEGQERLTLEKAEEAFVMLDLNQKYNGIYQVNLDLLR